MARPGPASDPSLPAGSVPAGTTELGVDIVKVDRIRAAMDRFGERFSRRVLTDAERRYVRDRSETFAGRWAAKEAVSKVLGLGVRGIGWRDIEIERLPTGQPSVRLHGRAAGRADQLGMDRIAVSITHEAEFAVAIAFGDPDRRRAIRLSARHRRPARRPGTGADGAVRAVATPARGHPGARRRASARPRLARPGSARCPVTDRRPVGFGHPAPPSEAEVGSASVPSGTQQLDDAIVARLVPERDKRGHKGSFGKLLVIAGSLDYAGAALLVCRAAGRAGVGLVTLAVPESLQPLFAAKVVEATTMALPEDDVEEVDPEPALAKVLDHDHDALVIGPGLRPSLAIAELLRLLLTTPEEPPGPWLEGETPRPPDGSPVVLDAEALRTLASADAWWARVGRACVLTPHAGEFARLRAGSGHDPGDDGDLGSDDEARARAAAAAAAEWRQVVVLKGARTVIAAPDGAVAVAPFENPAMASGGTGDVLAGTIGALLAQGLRRSMPQGWASTSTGWPGTPCASGSGTPGCWPVTCRMRCPSAAAASPESRSANVRAGGSASVRARDDAGGGTGVPG